MAMALAHSAALAQVKMNVDATLRGPLTNKYQYGLFFEEINHAGEGGLYAELVNNRSFETGLDAWTACNKAQISLTSENLLNNIQTKAVEINTIGASATSPKGISNSGFWGMNIRKDSTYTLTLWAKGSNKFENNITASLYSETTGQTLGTAVLKGTVNENGWSKLTATIKALRSDKQGSLNITTATNGKLYLDMVSLFPYTWKNRKNGLRPDLAELLAQTKPAFLRFPGGCYVEGQDSYDNAFQWKKTIGPIEQRPGHWNKNWGYFSTDGLGFDEYLQLCEDLNAAPMFVVNVGLGHNYSFSLEDTKPLVQDALDAIEYANGDVSTEWGAKRAANGHPAPYNIKFIEVGNENYQAGGGQQSEQYAERYYMFYKAIKEKYPDMVVIGNVESWGTDSPSWRNDYPVEMVDEHYYRHYSWMRNNYCKYDNYNRQIGVYVGEYAANGGDYGKYGNMNSALGEAVFMMGMEKNSDVCKMASFAPIFTHEENPAWPYDMIHFNAADNFVTPSFYVQQLFGENLGRQNLLWTESGNKTGLETNMKIGLGTWSTQAVFDNVEVTRTSGDALLADNFDGGMANWTAGDGSWAANGGELLQTSGATNCTAILNLPVAEGNYIYKVRAKKTGGQEGFLIIFNYADAKNYTWWNIGGWGNTKCAVENCVNGAKSTIAETTKSINSNEWYDIEIQVKGSRIVCRMNGSTIHDFNMPTAQAVYQTVQLNEDEGEMIVKIANPNSQAQQVDFTVSNMNMVSATVQTLAAADGTTENTMEQPDNIKPGQAESIALDSKKAVKLNIPAYSLNVYRIKVSDIEAETPEEYPQAYKDEDADKYAYLYAHMHQSREITCYATSKMGTYWEDMFSGNEVFDTKANTTTGGMRDAFIYRKPDGGFMLAATDMTSRLGWTSNHIMILMESPDMVHWTKNVKIDLETPENLKALGGITADEMTAAWAPQIIYDKATGKYVMYYSVGFPDRHRIYYQLIDKNLNILSEPALYFDPGYDIIDADIIWNEMEQRYVMIYKCEKTSGFDRATATHLVPGAGETEGTCQWTITDGFHFGDNNQAIEAPTQWRPINSKSWNMSYINYSGNGYGYKVVNMGKNSNTTGSPLLISGKVAAQHGSIIKITEAEYNYLKTWEKVKTMLPTVEEYYKATGSKEIADAIAKAGDALNNSTTADDNHTRMEDALKALEGCEDIYTQYVKNQLEQGNAVDITALIANADFSQGPEGWTVSGAFTQANGEVAEYWNTPFDFHQTVEGLPEGDYLLSVKSFYRYGGIDEAVAAHRAGTESLNAKIYANSVEMPVMSIYSPDTVYSYSPYNFPNNVTAANEAFNVKDLYTHTLAVTLSKPGNITLGIKKAENVYNDWCCFDTFTLKYLGKTSGAANIKKNTANKNVYYNLKGQQVKKKQMPKGIYISNNKKVIKKY